MHHDEKFELMPILEYIDRLTPAHATSHVLVAVDHYFLNINNLKLTALLGKINNTLISNFLFEWIVNRAPKEVEQLINENDFIITKTGFQGPEFTNTNNSMLKKLLGGRQPLQSFDMSDGSNIFVYRGKSHDSI